MKHTDESHHDADCRECPLATRREFMRDAATAVAAIALSLGISRKAFAAPLTLLEGRMGPTAETRSYPIPATEGAQIDRDAQLILVRWKGAVYAFSLSCPHQNTALRWNQDAARFQCPKHHSQYQPDGEFIEGRATRGMDRLAIKREGNNVIVDIDTMYKQNEDAASWDAAVVKVA